MCKIHDGIILYMILFCYCLFFIFFLHMAGLKYIYIILVLMYCGFLSLSVFTGLLSCFSVDEYIAIAKEKHGYNMEQVLSWFSFVVKMGF